MPSSDPNWERDLAIWERALRFESHTSIAADIGLSVRRVGQIIAAMAGRLPEFKKAEFVAQTSELYARWIHETAKLVDAEPIPAYSNGRPIVDTEGRAVMDHTGRLAAMREGRAITESWRKMLGIDAPARAEVDVRARHEYVGVDLEQL